MTPTHLSDSQLADLLRRSGMRPSAQRIDVLAVLCSGSHPSAEEIFATIAPRYPSLSRTTVYNSLHAMVQTGLVNELEIETACMRYDLAPEHPHCHFVCTDCGRIFDNHMPPGIMGQTDAGFIPASVELTYRGTCPECAARHACVQPRDGKSE